MGSAYHVLQTIIVGPVQTLKTILPKSCDVVNDCSPRSDDRKDG